MKLTENAMKVLENRILRKDENGNVVETPEEMVQRVAATIADATTMVAPDGTIDRIYEGRIIENEFADIMRNLYFLPNSPCLANAGTEIEQLLACFVLPIEDDMESIMGTLKDAAMIHRSGGGTGFSFSNLRPANDIVKTTGGIASGPVSFMRMYDAVTNEIKQGGRRRGANISVLRCDHPDILEFIDCKQDNGQINNFNISVAVTDKFMQAVKDDKNFNLINPRTGVREQTIPAKRIWSKLVDGAWLNGEPGIIFIDTVNKHNPLPELGEIEGVNPCFTGDMRLMLADGSYKTFKELAGKEVEIMSNDGLPSEGKVWKVGVKDTVRIRLSDGTIIKCTPDHKFMTLDDETIKAKDLKGKKIMPNLNYRVKHDPFYVKLGFINGDGQLSRLNSETHAGLEVNIGINDGDMWQYFNGDDYTVTKCGRAIYLTGYKEHFQRLGFDAKTLPYRTLPKTYWSWDRDDKASFLKGLFSANGGVIRGHRIAHKTSCRKLAEQMQLTLKRDFDITAYITKNKSKDVKFSNGTYRCRKSYDVNVSRYESLLKYYNMVGFCHKYKEEHLLELIMNRCPYVGSVKQNGKQFVYDFSEPRNNWGIVEGYVAHNCGESVLLNNESCCLGSINLSKMVREYKKIGSAIGRSEVNWELLERVTHIAIRFLDNVLDATEYPLPQIKEMSLGNRKIGLGVMGWGDMLFKLGIPYNSEEAINLAGDVMGYIDAEAFYTSLKLAEEKGVFPNYHKSPTFQEKVGKCRNASLTSIAPTGTLSAIAGCTSGIEPAYGLVYTKNVMDGTILYEVNPVFEQELKNRGIYSKKLLQKIADNKGSCQGIAEIPEDMQKVFVVAHDISPEWHVKMQVEFQKNVGMGISKTCNLPHNATKEDVEKVYRLAYDLGCKGVTVYRDGSRENQVLSTGNTKEEPIKVKVEVRDRPVETSGITTALKTGCGKLYATVNEDDHGICELFLNQRDGNGCRVAYNNALAMVMSMALRAGVPIKDISKALKGQSCGQPVWENGTLILSCPDAIGKLLDKEQEFQDFKHEVKEDVPISVPKKRCSCGGELINQGGCEVCRDCGWERCGG